LPSTPAAYELAKEPRSPSYAVEDEVKPVQFIVLSGEVRPEPRSTLRWKAEPPVMPDEAYSFTLEASEPVYETRMHFATAAPGAWFVNP
jgi:hypothetical protein